VVLKAPPLLRVSSVSRLPFAFRQPLFCARRSTVDPVPCPCAHFCGPSPRVGHRAFFGPVSTDLFPTVQRQPRRFVLGVNATFPRPILISDRPATLESFGASRGYARDIFSLRVPPYRRKLCTQHLRGAAVLALYFQFSWE